MASERGAATKSRTVGVFLWCAALIACGGDRVGTGRPSGGPAFGAPPTIATPPVAVVAPPSTVEPTGTPPTVPYRFLGDDGPGNPPGRVEVPVPVVGDTSLPATCSFEVGPASSRLACHTGQDVFWSHVSRRTDAAALLAFPSILVAVHYAPHATGAELATYDLRSGEPLTRFPLQGLGPVAHSEYANRIELISLSDGSVAIFGNESSGKYVEVVDVGAGRTISIRRAEEAQARALPPPPTESIPPTGERWADVKGAPVVASSVAGARVIRTPKASCRLYSLASPPGVPFGERIGFECKDAAGAVLLAEEHGRAGVDAENAVIAPLGDRSVLAMVRYSAMASGATLVLYDLASGTTSHVVPLIGLGPVAHSKYHNDVRLVIRGNDVVVYGAESQGRYVEVRNLTSGKLVGLSRR